MLGLASLPPGLLSPWALALLGLAVGSFLNVVVHRLPLMLERQWWGDVAAQLADGDSFRRVFAAAAPERLAQAGGALESRSAPCPPLNLARPGVALPVLRPPHPLVREPARCSAGWRCKGRCSACGARIALRYPLVELATAAALRRRGLARGAAAGRRCCGAAWWRRCWRWP